MNMMNLTNVVNAMNVIYVNILLFFILLISILYRFNKIPIPVLICISLLSISPVLLIFMDKNNSNIRQLNVQMLWTIFLTISVGLSFVNNPCNNEDNEYDNSDVVSDEDDDY